jgi:hypothetical protein
LHNCKSHHGIKVKWATRLSLENQVPLRGYYGGHPPKK